MEFLNSKRIEKLKQLIVDTYTPLIDGDYVMLDFPNYRNIGDNLIWKGEEEFMKTIPYKCLYSANVHTFQKNKIPKNAIILLQGGGNFGDMYTVLQSFRLRLIEDFPNNKIIIFPQTVHFEDQEEFKRQAKILKAHKNLYITARDTVSQENLRKQGIVNKVLLLPDMAFCIDFRSYFNNDTKGKSLYMKRVDSELNTGYNQDKIQSILENKKLNNKIDVLDWPSYTSNYTVNKLVEYADALESKISKTIVSLPILGSFIDSQYGLNSKDNLKNYIEKGIGFLNSYDVIATTRLHGFILSVLLNKEVIIVDNSYGKNSNFYNTWMSDFEKVELLNKN